ncbi:MAG TPA: pyridoxamine 5'-phosphate oxidase family protein [Nitrososphaeraceae archaeon]|jgi:nitroimidazol reductase NimA-like FMN-containing flavoprotein (pyridoxamine 5'-phosphate oxidase superfamily)|nr:pyridoxamine 5'-phosphate oxidase family protein [Nitrososphaeraceae archaeon]
MKLIKKLEIQSKQNIINFLNNQAVGRLATIDINGFPQVIPMNFVYVQAEKFRDNSYLLKEDSIYMHSYRFGEKIDNIKRNSTTGFETDQHLAFLPSYYFHPYDASQADTLYISVVIKGHSYIVEDKEEKALALNSLMEKYQKEGNYEKLNSNMHSVQEVTVIKLIPHNMKGKYKIGQQWTPSYRLKIAKNILAREKDNAKLIFEVMGIEILENETLKIKKEPIL